MSGVSSTIIDVLRYLLPGFLAAWVFYGLTPYPKPSEFERTVQALIFNLFVQAGSVCVQWLCLLVGRWHSLGEWNVHSELFSSLVCATVVGFAFAYFANSDRFHSLLRKIKITKETSYASEWYGVFSKKLSFVVLHLNDGRRVYGWPIHWPSEPTVGHFSLVQASWLSQEGNENVETPLSGVDAILIKASDVSMVEFMKTQEEVDESKSS